MSDQDESASQATALREISVLLTTQEAAIDQHPAETKAVYHNARERLQAGMASAALFVSPGSLRPDQATLVNSYVLTSSFISAWFHLLGDKERRDRAAHSCCILVTTAGRLDAELVMSRYVKAEQLWRMELRPKRGKMFATLPLWSTVALAVPMIDFWRLSSLGVGPLARFGSSISQLGYVILLAGIITGSFGVFGLHSRRAVFTVGVATWLLGTVLVNL